MINIPTLVDRETFLEIFDKVIEKAQDGIVIVEVGVLVGGSICYLSQKLQEKKIKYHLVAIDNFKFDTINGDDVRKYTNGTSPYIAYSHNIRKAKARVTTIIGDSVEVSRLFQDDSIDFLFLDGDHSLPYVEKELIAWLPKMKPNSMIAGHDYNTSPDIQVTCEKILTNVELTSTKTSYFKKLGDGIMPNRERRERKERDKTPKIGIRFILWLYRGWGYVKMFFKMFSGGK